MERRTFLTLAGVAASAAFGTSRAFAMFVQDDERHPHEPDVASELGVAAAMGKPLLVLVRPRVENNNRDLYALLRKRQTALGNWLHHGSEPSMALLSLCHVTSASMEEMRAAVPEAAGRMIDEPWLVLVETGGMKPRVQTADGMPPGPPMPEGLEESHWRLEGYHEREAHAEEVARHRRAQLDAWLTELLDPARLDDRAREALAALSPDDQRRFEQVVLSPTLANHDLLWRAAAATLWHSEHNPRSAGEALVAALATTSVKQLRDRAPRGSHWATSGGCGTRVKCDLPEPGPRFGIGCGMGHVPGASRNFLQMIAEH